jgi:hypothetical protein
MDFPSKFHPSQSFTGYLRDNLALVDSWSRSGVPASAVLALICKATGEDITQSTFNSTLYRLRRQAKSSPVGLAAPTPKVLPQTLSTAPASLQNSSQSNPQTLRNIMTEQIDLSGYPRKFVKSSGNKGLLPQS